MSCAQGQPVLILGMHRSGTSFLAQMLQSMGVFIGDELVSGQRGNERGHFEAVPVLEFHQRLIAKHRNDKRRAFDEDMLVQEPIMDSFLPEDAEAAAAIIKRLSREGSWGWKEPRTCLLLAAWLKLLPRAKGVIVYRHPLEVHQSLLRRGHWDLSLFPDQAMQAYTVYNKALLETPDTFRACTFNATAGFRSMRPLAILMAERLSLTLPKRLPSFYRKEFADLGVSAALHELFRLVYPEAAATFEQLQAASDIPLEFAEHPGDATFIKVREHLEPLLADLPEAARAHFGPVLDFWSASGQGGNFGQYAILAAEIAERVQKVQQWNKEASRIYEDNQRLSAELTRLGSDYKEQQAAFKAETEEKAALYAKYRKLWSDYKELDAQSKELGQSFKEQQAAARELDQQKKQLWTELNQLGVSYKEQQAAFKAETEEKAALYAKYRKLWSDYKELDAQSKGLGQSFKEQQAAARELDQQKKQLWTELNQLGVSYKEQQAAFKAETEEKAALYAKYRKLWSDYKELDAQSKELGQSFKEQQAAFKAETEEKAGLYEKYRKLWSDYKELDVQSKQLGQSFKEQQAAFKAETEEKAGLYAKYRKLWSDYKELDVQSKQLGQSFKEQQAAFKAETEEKAGLYAKYRKLWSDYKELDAQSKQLGGSFKEQQAAYRKQFDETAELHSAHKKLWDDYKELDTHYKELGKGFQAQQAELQQQKETNARIWQDLQRVGESWKEQQAYIGRLQQKLRDLEQRDKEK